MTGKRESARPAFPGNRAGASGWPALSTEDVRCGLDMATDRLLYDDGGARPWRRTAEKIQGNRRVEHWVATDGIYRARYGPTALRGYKDLMCKTILIAAATRRANEMTS